MHGERRSHKRLYFVKIIDLRRRRRDRVCATPKYICQAGPIVPPCARSICDIVTLPPAIRSLVPRLMDMPLEPCVLSLNAGRSEGMKACLAVASTAARSVIKAAEGFLDDPQRFAAVAGVAKAYQAAGVAGGNASLVRRLDHKALPLNDPIWAAHRSFWPFRRGASSGKGFYNADP